MCPVKINHSVPLKEAIGRKSAHQETLSPEEMPQSFMTFFFLLMEVAFDFAKKGHIETTAWRSRSYIVPAGNFARHNNADLLGSAVG